MEGTDKQQVHGLVRVFTEDEVKEARETGKILSIDLELTKRCNFNCIYCYADGGKPNPEELSLDEIKDVLDQAKGLGAKKVTITGGEPMTRPDFWEVVEYARGIGLSVNLYTNGSLVDEKAAKRLAELDVFPCVKLDSRDPMTQDRLAGKMGAFDKIMEGIGNLQGVGYGKERQMNINTVITAKNINGLEELWWWCREHGIQPMFLRLGPKGRAVGKDSLVVGAARLRELFLDLAAIDWEYKIHWEATTPFCGRGCHKHYISCYVGSTGNVQPCTGVDVHGGNIREQPLKDIVADSEVFKVARNMEKHIKGACRDCKYLDRCYGCRGLAYYYEGDFTAADPLCWNNPDAI
jgi:radical SAM protein with 4Fe4S-binding SPASM domain